MSNESYHMLQLKGPSCRYVFEGCFVTTDWRVCVIKCGASDTPDHHRLELPSLICKVTCVHVSIRTRTSVFILSALIIRPATQVPSYAAYHHANALHTEKLLIFVGRVAGKSPPLYHRALPCASSLC